MSQIFPGFLGPSYYLAGKYSAVERTVNWMLVANEAAGEESKFKIEFEPAPGNQAFSALPVPSPFNQPNRGLLENRGVVYGVNGDTVFSIDKNGNFTNLGGPIYNDGTPVGMAANGNGQIFICSGSHGAGYVIPKNALPGSLITIPIGDFKGAAYTTFQDGYILNVVPDSNQFQISGTDDVPLGDATLWSGANISVQAGQADNLRAILSSREYVRILGARRTQIYSNVGANGIGGFPFQSYNETFIETGISAAHSLADLGDSLIWIGEDARGVRACWRDAAFQPQRISTFSIEQQWQSYANVADAVAFPFIWNGHLLYQITFPSAFVEAVTGSKTSATWLYDATTSALLGRPIWTERQYQNALGSLGGRPELFHCYAYGKHLVGSGGADGNPGAIYQYSGAMQAIPAPNPQVLLRWSNDAGNTYGNEQNIAVGPVGQYAIRALFNRCGYARDRVFWLRVADPSFTECGTDVTGAQVQQQIIMDRICPHLWSTNKRVIYNRIEFELTRAPGYGSNPWSLVTAELDMFVCAS